VENALYYFHADLDSLSDLKLTIRHMKEKNLVSDLDSLKPEYFAIEKWAYCSFRMLSESFLNWLWDRYSLATKKSHFDIYKRK